MNNRADVGVVVVTYHPEGDIESRLVLMAAQGGGMVVVDNDSGELMSGRLREICTRRGWDFVPNLVNLGLGVALNQGASLMVGRGFALVMFFDQDSEPQAEMSKRMLETLETHPETGRVAVVGANFRERSTGRYHRVLRRHPLVPGGFQKIAPTGMDLTDVLMVITSGSMVRATDYEALGKFDEDYFIDYIDTDFCLRCVERGRLVAVSAAAWFDHDFGQRTRRRWCGIELLPTNHSALRHYYIARNRIPMWRRHAWRLPHWALFDLATAGLWLFRVLAAEEQKGRKVRAMMLGTWDGLLGRMGPCPDRQRAVLSS